MSKKIYLKNSVIYLLGELTSKIMPFLLLPYLSRKLGVEGFGELSYYQVYLAVFSIFLGFSQDGAVSRYFYFYGIRSIALIVNVSYVYISTLAIFMIIIFSLFKAEIMIYLVITSAFQSLLAIQLSLRQCQKKAFSYTLIQIALAFLGVIFTIILFEFYNEKLVEKRILAILFSNAIVFIIAKILSNKKSKVFGSSSYKKAVLYLFSFGLPLVLHNVSGLLKGHLDRIFIFHLFSEFELGLYSMGATLASVISTLLMALNKSINPYYFEALKQKKISIELVHKYAIYSLFICPIFILFIFFIPDNIFTFLLGEQFLGVKYYFLIFSSAQILNIPYIILANYLYFYGETNKIALCSIISTVIYVLSLMILINTNLNYIPFASILSMVSILPLLFLITKQVSRRYL